MAMASSEDFTLTREEAFSFLLDVLKIESAENKLTENKVDFLEETIRAYGRRIPYQTVTSLAVSPGERRFPTAAVVKRDAFAQLGGICYHQNVFFWMLLRALGFNACLVASEESDEDHIHDAIVISDVTSEGSKHFVDVGNGYPTFRLFPLDFEHVSPEYIDSYVRYRFMRQGEGVIVFQLSVDSKPPEARGNEDLIKDGWFSYDFMRIDKPVHVSHFEGPMTPLLTVVSDKVFFLTSLRCFAYPNGRFVCIKDSKLLLENDDRKVQVSRFKSPDEIVEAFARYFPQFSENMVKSAMGYVQINFNKK